MPKMCLYFPKKRCYHSSCVRFDRVSGKVIVCRFFRSSFTPRMVKTDLRSVSR